MKMLIPNCRRLISTQWRFLSNKASEPYVQGQEPEPGIREYFYYVDHHGMLFQDDSRMKHWTAALKEKKLLHNFFKRIRHNQTGRYESEFKYISLCGRERNFVRCDDIPIVFSSLVPGPTSGSWMLEYNHAGPLLQQPFSPASICMIPHSGRVYHQGPRFTGGFGLIADKLSILWTQEQRFIFTNGEEESPTGFIWDNEEIKLDNHLLELVQESYSNKVLESS